MPRPDPRFGNTARRPDSEGNAIWTTAKAHARARRCFEDDDRAAHLNTPNRSCSFWRKGPDQWGTPRPAEAGHLLAWRRSAFAKMPKKPACRFFSTVSRSPTTCCKAHGWRSTGYEEKIVIACLLHDTPTRASFEAIMAIGVRNWLPLCGRRGQLGDPRPPGAALHPDEWSVRISRTVHSAVRARF